MPHRCNVFFHSIIVLKFEFVLCNYDITCILDMLYVLTKYIIFLYCSNKATSNWFVPPTKNSNYKAESSKFVIVTPLWLTNKYLRLPDLWIVFNPKLKVNCMFRHYVRIFNSNQTKLFSSKPSVIYIVRLIILYYFFYYQWLLQQILLKLCCSTIHIFVFFKVYQQLYLFFYIYITTCILNLL